MSISFGIDFGTTNSSLSANFNGEVRLIDVEEYLEGEEGINPKLLRSVLYFDDEHQVFIGQKAIAQYIGDNTNGRYMQSIKTFLPDLNFIFTSIYDKDYGLEELISIILKKMKTRGEELLNQEVSDVVLGRPASFDEDHDIDVFAEERLRSAARIAGFKNITFQFEPVAAALAFESNLPEGDEKKVLVGDLGGGTSDFTMIKLRGGPHQQKKERKADILAVGGIYVGGDRFDSDIMWGKIAKYFGREVKVKDSLGKNWLPVPALIYKLRQWHLIPQLRDPKMRETIRDLKFRAEDPRSIERLEILIEENYGLMLFQEIERAKQQLSSSPSATIAFQENGYNPKRMGGLLSIKEDLTRDEFEELIDSDVNKINRCVDEVMQKSGIKADDIDIVFLTGGSSYIPIIRKSFADRFGPEKLIQQDAFTSVAYGLGLYASIAY